MYNAMNVQNIADCDLAALVLLPSPLAGKSLIGMSVSYLIFHCNCAKKFAIYDLGPVTSEV